MKILLGFLLALTIGAQSGCGTVDKTEETPSATSTPAAAQQDSDVDRSDPINVTITLEDGRVMTAALYPHVAPKSVENFVKLAKEGFYDGLIFHRVIPGFMIQGGGYDETFYDGNFDSKETETIQGEFSSNGVKNNLKHTKGVLSMARTMEKNSASSQFFIMQEDAPHLDEEYAAFGEITSGLEVVDEVANVKTTELTGTVTSNGMKYSGQKMSDVPEKPIVIKSITVAE